MWRAIVGNRSLFDRATGKLTESGVRAARSAGLDPDTLTPDLAANFATIFVRLVSRAIIEVLAILRLLSFDSNHSTEWETHCCQ